MEKRMVIWAVLVAFLAVASGCVATKNQLEKTDIKVAKLEGFTECLKQEISATKKYVGLVEEGFSKTKGEVKAMNDQIAGLNQRVDVVQSDVAGIIGKVNGTDARINDVNTKLQQVRGEYRNLREYASNIRKIVAEREAKDTVAGTPDEPKVFLLGQFPTGTSVLNKTLENQLEKAAADLKSKNLEVTHIQGFASILGVPGKSEEENEKMNKDLSLARAKSIATALKARKIDFDDSVVSGMGGVVKFGTQMDNQCVVVLAKSSPPAQTASQQTPPPNSPPATPPAKP